MDKDQLSNIVDEINKRSTISIRCTLDEHKEINRRAESNGMSTSDYVRFVCLNAEIEVIALEKIQKEERK